MNDQILQNFRNQIDAIDQELFAILKRRSNVVADVGVHKRKTQKERCFLRPAREAIIIKNLKQQDVGHFPNEHLYAIWRLLIAASTNIEQVLTVSVCENSNGLYLAREYFGPTAPITIRKSESEIIADIKNGHSLIGFMPPPESSQNQWWLELNTIDSPKLFAIAPLIADSKIPNAYLIADVKPEQTDNDKSWLISETLVAAGRLIAKNLYELDGFHTGSGCIGSYATQIRI